MPPRAVYDSEDDDEVLVEEEKPSQRSTVSGCIAHAEEVLAQWPSLDCSKEQSNHRSSLSTGELNRQIRDVQRGFFDSASGQSKAMPAQSSQSKPTSGPRHTNTSSSASIETPSKKLKRNSTTITTYGTKAGTTRVNNEDVVFAVMRDGDPAPRTSQSNRFSDHSQGLSTPERFPAGTIGRDFQDHEPHMMFNDTGSTVAYNESSEQRMVEQALQSAKGHTSSAVKAAESEKDPSSPFPWSTSAGPTQSPRSNQSKKSKQDCNHDVHVAEQDLAIVHQDRPQLSTNDELPNTIQESAQSLAMPQSRASASHMPMMPTSSPQVIINTAGIPAEAHVETAQKPMRGRKRKASVANKEEAVDSLNSDDRGVGLPKELYQPRPSRRRMTQLPDDRIDYSAVPEKASKKRRKTASDFNDDQLDTALDVSQGSRKKAAEDEDAQTRNKPAHKETTTSTPTLPQASTPQEDTMKPIEANKDSPTRPMPSPLSSPAEPDIKNHSPVKPSLSPSKMGPPSLPASATKKRIARSHTTIFEDCSPRSQSLRQRQAERLSAVQYPDKSSAQSNRKRRTIVQDDEDDGDELSKEDVEPTAPPPRKRGRPSKAEAQKKAAAAAAAKEAADELADDYGDDNDPVRGGRKVRAAQQSLVDAATDEDLVAGKVPAKRGRKPKSTAKVLEDSDDDAGADIELGVEGEEQDEEEDELLKKKSGKMRKKKPDDVVLRERVSSSKPDQKDTPSIERVPTPALQTKDANAQTSKPEEGKCKAQTPTPGQENPAKKDTGTPQKAATGTKNGPNSHSPIRKSLKALPRVGLNKKQRIQPLLKMVRPAPLRKNEIARVTTVTSVAELERRLAAKEDD